jgi:hypothetical protein
MPVLSSSNTTEDNSCTPRLGGVTSPYRSLSEGVHHGDGERKLLNLLRTVSRQHLMVRNTAYSSLAVSQIRATQS